MKQQKIIVPAGFGIDPFFSIDPAGHITAVNFATEKITGSSATDLNKASFPDLFTEPQKAREMLLQVFTEGVVDDFQLSFCPLNGTKGTTVLFNAYRDMDEHGKVKKALAIARVATEPGRSQNGSLQKIQKEISDYKYALDESSIVAITDQKGIIKHVNNNFCKISKYSREELIGQDHRIINSGYHPKEFIRYLWVTIATGKIWKGELKNKAKDGTYYWVDTTIIPFLNEEKKPYQYVAIRADITERKRVEEEVIKAYREKETVLNRINDAVVSVDSDWHYTFLNDAALSTHPLGKEETLGKVIWDVHPEMKGTIFWDKYHEAMRTGKVVEIEDYYPPMDIWFSVKVYPSVDGLTIFYKDITQAKIAEQKLSQSVREVTDYKFALDEANIVAITDQKGIIKHANHNFCKISKYSLDELIGQDHRIINSGYHSKEFIRNLWVTIANGKIWRGELKNKARDGTIYWVDTTIVPFLNEEGKPYQYVAIRADITQRKKAEEDIMILNEELEKRVKERTEEMESFSYSVSHDLRAPLRAINSYAKIIEEDYGDIIDNEGRRLLGEVHENAKKMGTLIDDLLAFSRLGRKDVERSVVDMTSLAEFAIREIGQTTTHHAEIKLRPLLPAMADQSLLQHVMINLVSNAVKYSSKNEKPFIEISSKRENNELIYSVTDNGVGFDMQYVDKLFGVFQRLHSADEFSGTGVGLAMVKRIIQKHNGKVWAEAKPGKGATFFFTIPETR